MKCLQTMTTEELAKVIHDHPKFSDLLFDRYLYDSIQFDYDEFLSGVPYHIEGGCCYSWSADINIDGYKASEDAEEFLKWYNDIGCCLISPETLTKEEAERFAELVDRYAEVYYDLSRENDDRLYSRLEELADKIEAAITSICSVIENEFDDPYYIADHVLCNEWLEDFYLDNDGSVLEYKKIA